MTLLYCSSADLSLTSPCPSFPGDSNQERLEANHSWFMWTMWVWAEDCWNTYSHLIDPGLDDIDPEVEQHDMVLITQPPTQDHYSVHHCRYPYMFCTEKLVMPSVYVDNFKTLISVRLWLVHSDTSMMSLLISIVKLEEMRISKFSICHIVFHLWPSKDVFSDSWHTV